MRFTLRNVHNINNIIYQTNDYVNGYHKHIFRKTDVTIRPIDAINNGPLYASTLRPLKEHTKIIDYNIERTYKGHNRKRKEDFPRGDIPI